MPICQLLHRRVVVLQSSLKQKNLVRVQFILLQFSPGFCQLQEKIKPITAYFYTLTKLHISLGKLNNYKVIEFLF